MITKRKTRSRKSPTGILKNMPDLGHTTDDASKSDLTKRAWENNLVFTRVQCDSDPNPKKSKDSWLGIMQTLEKPQKVGSLSLKKHIEYNKDPEQKHLSEAQKIKSSIIPGVFNHKKIKENNLIECSMLVIELDDGHFTVKSLESVLKKLGLECFAHTSFLNSKNENKFTVYFPFDKTLKKDISATYSRAVSWLNSKLENHINPKCWSATQSYLLPSCPVDSVNLFKHIHIKGKPLAIYNFKVDKIDLKVIETDCKSSDDNIVEDFNKQGDWSKLLSPLGLSYSFTDKGHGYYMGAKKQMNVILGCVDHAYNVFYLFAWAEVGAPLITGRAYTLFEAYRKIKHKGKAAAAKKALLSKGYGEPEGSDETVETYKLSSLERAELLFPETEFPLNAFPEYFRNLVTSYAKANQCPVPVMMLIMLTIFSAAVGNSVNVQLKEGCSEIALFIWLLVIDATGAGSTNPIDSALRPILNMQARGSVGALDIDENNGKKQFYAQSPSIESLIEKFSESSHGIVIHSSDIASFIEKMNQQKNKIISDYNNLNRLFECKPLFSDSKNGQINCWESGAAIIGGVNPSRNYEVFNESPHGNGLAYNFLLTPINSEPQMFTEDSISKEVEKQWLDILTWAYNIPTSIDPETRCIIKKYLTVGKDGKDSFKRFHDKIMGAQELMPDKFKGYIPKLVTYCLKFSGLIHLLNCYPDHNKMQKPIGKVTIMGAKRLTKYYASQTLNLTSERKIVEDPYQERLIKCLISLKDEVNNRKLLLSRVLDKINEQLPLKLSLTSHQLGTLLRRRGLEVKPSTNNKSFVYWDDSKILDVPDYTDSTDEFEREYFITT